MSRPKTPNGQIRRFLELKNAHPVVGDAFTEAVDQIVKYNGVFISDVDFVDKIESIFQAEGKSEKTAQKMAHSVGNRALILLKKSIHDLRGNEDYKNSDDDRKKEKILEEFNQASKACPTEKRSVMNTRLEAEREKSRTQNGVFGGMRIIHLNDYD